MNAVENDGLLPFFSAVIMNPLKNRNGKGLEAGFDESPSYKEFMFEEQIVRSMEQPAPVVFGRAFHKFTVNHESNNVRTEDFAKKDKQRRDT